MEKFKGIYPALVTPYTKDGDVDHEMLKKLIDKLIDEGVDGFYATGSSAECFFLSEQERNDVVTTVCEHTNKRVKVIVHIGALSTDHAIGYAKHAQKVGADAISAVPPFYFKYSFDEIKGHYFSIMDSVNLPMIAYNFPALSGIDFTIAHIEAFSEHKNFGGIKHTCKDLYLLEQFKAVNEKLSVFNGHDEVHLPALAVGADGAIGSTFNFMAPKYIKMTKLFQEGKADEALELQKEANVIINAMIACGVHQTIKYILGKQGIECNGCRKPMAPISEEKMKILDGIMKYI